MKKGMCQTDVDGIDQTPCQGFSVQKVIAHSHLSVVSELQHWTDHFLKIVFKCSLNLLRPKRLRQTVPTQITCHRNHIWSGSTQLNKTHLNFCKMINNNKNKNAHNIHPWTDLICRWGQDTLVSESALVITSTWDTLVKVILWWARRCQASYPKCWQVLLSVLPLDT